MPENEKTRLAGIPLIIIMIVAIATTKAAVLADKGFWEMLHGSRTDCNAFGQYFSFDKKAVVTGSLTKE